MHRFAAVFALSFVVQVQYAGAFPALTNSIRRNHIRSHKHHQHQKQAHSAEQVQSSVQLPAQLMSADGELADQQQAVVELQQQDAAPQLIGMRVLNTQTESDRHWKCCWIETTVSRSEYVIALAYFCMFTLLILFSRYIYDFMGCYEPLDHKKSPSLLHV